MKAFVCVFLLLISALIFLPEVMSARRILRQRSDHSHHHATLPSTKDGEKANPNFYGDRRRPAKHRRADPLQAGAGSTLPDCSHACGSCSPCRLVMVSFVCASLAEAETCPMAYKCMCNHRSYPVP